MRWDTPICKTQDKSLCLQLLADWWFCMSYWGAELQLGTNKLNEIPHLIVYTCCTKLMERTERREKQLQNFQTSFLCFYWSKKYISWAILSLTAHLSFRRENDLAQQDCSRLGKFLLSFYFASSEDCSDCKNKSRRLLE